MTATPQRLRRLVMGLLVLAAGLSCVEGPFEPWDPERDDRPFRFLAGAATGTPLLALTPGRVANDSTLEIDIRMRDVNVPVAGLAFEVVQDTATVALDTMSLGSFLLPAERAVIVEFVSSDGAGARWTGVVALDSLSTGVGGSGVLGTMRVRRRNGSAFTTEIRFDTTNTVAYGPDGLPVTMHFAGGRVQHTPR